MRKYATRKIAAANVYDLYEEYKEWINTINQRTGFKTTIVSTNLVQNESWCCMIVTYYYDS
nr:MAG TPA: hypothetical protein [Caudoviricetes sp.]DAT07260.1 MAG TPA: hypothetical protein [Caudoviricetes sp.]